MGAVGLRVPERLRVNRARASARPAVTNGPFAACTRAERRGAQRRALRRADASGFRTRARLQDVPAGSLASRASAPGGGDLGLPSTDADLTVAPNHELTPCTLMRSRHNPFANVARTLVGSIRLLAAGNPASTSLGMLLLLRYRPGAVARERHRGRRRQEDVVFDRMKTDAPVKPLKQVVA
jgi:hypothetical protein